MNGELQSNTQIADESGAASVSTGDFAFSDPYRSPRTATELPVTSPVRRRIQTLLCLVAWLYPVWLAGSFYLTWLTAWLFLGHPPRPMLDDPVSISRIVDGLYFLTGLLIMGMPGLCPAGLVASFLMPLGKSPRTQMLSRTALVGGYLVLCVSCIVLLRSDPLRVVEWWFD